MSNVQSMASRIMLVAFSTGGRPRFNRKNKAEAQKVASAHGVDTDKVGVGVTQCKHPVLGEIDKLHAEIYEWHRVHTLPTITPGMRQLKVDFQMEYLKGMGEYERKNTALLEAFYADYPALKDDAPRVNNGLYDPAPWKPIEVLREKHKWQLQVLPCPSEGEWVPWLEASLATAQADLTERLEEAIRRVAERCASDGRLFQSVFSNLDELLTMVPHLDLTNDPKIREIAARAEYLASRNKDTLVANTHVRQEVAARANDILGMFGTKL